MLSHEKAKKQDFGIVDGSNNHEAGEAMYEDIQSVTRMNLIQLMFVRKESFVYFTKKMWKISTKFCVL